MHVLLLEPLGQKLECLRANHKYEPHRENTFPRCFRLDPHRSKSFYFGLRNLADSAINAVKTNLLVRLSGYGAILRLFALLLFVCFI